MVSTQDLQSVVGFALWAVACAGVAAVVTPVTRAVGAKLAEHHSIPREDLDRIAESYGWWAARRAEAFCPHNDVACVEREAKRLYESAVRRR
jgi:hypothetical protein